MPSRTSESATLSEYASTPPVSPQMAIAPVGRRGWERRGEQLHAASFGLRRGRSHPTVRPSQLRRGANIGTQKHSEVITHPTVRPSQMMRGAIIGTQKQSEVITHPIVRPSL
jgi:hypothetical protein